MLRDAVTLDFNILTDRTTSYCNSGSAARGHTSI